MTSSVEGDLTRSALDKGHDLEAEIERFFAANGYETARNLMLEGRSGGRHEIDVLAKKSDGITQFSTMIECKAWNHPIEKDIVSKVSYVVRDLGLNKGIIVSLEGWRIGAEKAAQELAIDLWDGSDLEKRLGQVLVSELRGTGRRRRARGLRPTLDQRHAESILLRQRTGLLGKEEIAWARLAWLPLYLFDVRISNTDKRMLAKDRVKSTVTFNLYEGLSGSYIAQLAGEPVLEEIEAENIIPARVADRKIVTAINRECAQLRKLVSQAARQRQARKVLGLGIPLPCETVAVDRATSLAWPYFVALLERKGKQRIVAVDGVAGKVSELMSRILTENLSYVREAVRD